jgi:hypothetical protein
MIDLTTEELMLWWKIKPLQPKGAYPRWGFVGDRFLLYTAFGEWEDTVFKNANGTWSVAVDVRFAITVRRVLPNLRTALNYGKASYFRRQLGELEEEEEIYTGSFASHRQPSRGLISTPDENRSRNDRELIAA